MHLVYHFLEYHAERTPGAVAAIHGGEQRNYAGINREANRVAHLLREMGVAPGDRVALALENSLDYISSYYGVLKAGGVTVAQYPNATPKTLKFVLNDCGVKAVIAREKPAQTIASLAEDLPDLKAMIVRGERKNAAPENSWAWANDESLARMPGENPDLDLIDLARASIIYTSGSTGDPRGAILSHLNIVANTRSIVEYLELTAQDRIMVVLPFPYVYGKSLLNTHFSVGGSVLLDNRFTFPNAVLKTMQAGEATGFSGVPSTFAILMHKSAVRKFEFPKLRYITQAGGHMAAPLMREVEEVFSQQKLFIMYGATEAAARLAYLDPKFLPEKRGAIGKAIPNVNLRVLKADGSEAGVGETGELVARGSNMMEGYWNKPEETAKVLDAHGFRTGDLARRDEDGFFYIVGRKRDMIKSGANRVSAKEVEETLLEHADILEAAVIGVADEILGEAIHAFVVPKDGGEIAEDEVIAFCRERLLEFKVPRKVIVETALPKNASGKLMKEELRKRFA